MGNYLYNLEDILDIDLLGQDIQKMKKYLFHFMKTDSLFLTRQGFMAGENWRSVREMAKSIRKKIGIGVCRDIPYPLDFHDFVELID